MRPPELDEPDRHVCGSCGASRAAGGGRVACLCPRKGVAPPLTYESGVCEELYELIQYRQIAHHVIAKAMDDAVGIIPSIDREWGKRRDLAKVMRHAREWLITPSPERAMWFEIAGMQPPTNTDALQRKLIWWLKYREQMNVSKMIAWRNTMLAIANKTNGDTKQVKVDRRGLVSVAD